IQGLNQNQIDGNMSDEIPNPQIDKKLQNIVIRNMVHGPCGTLNPTSRCMKCTKMYPRQLISETQTARDGYPIYSTTIRLTLQLTLRLYNLLLRVPHGD